MVVCLRSKPAEKFTIVDIAENVSLKNVDGALLEVPPAKFVQQYTEYKEACCPPARQTE